MLLLHEVLESEFLEPLGISLRHRITHHAIEVELWRGTPSKPLPRSTTLKLIDPLAPRVALTALARRAAEAVHATEREDRSC